MIVGCDPSTKRCALADEAGRCASVLLHPRDDNGKRLAWSYRQIETFTRQFCDPPPICVVVEQPSGRFRQPTLVEVVGVTRAAIYSALEDVGPVAVFLMPPKMWKAATVGATADKTDYCAWAAQEGAVFANDDEAAAYCIARAGVKLLTNA